MISFPLFQVTEVPLADEQTTSFVDIRDHASPSSLAVIPNTVQWPNERPKSAFLYPVDFGSNRMPVRRPANTVVKHEDTMPPALQSIRLPVYSDLFFSQAKEGNHNVGLLQNLVLDEFSSQSISWCLGRHWMSSGPLGMMFFDHSPFQIGGMERKPHDLERPTSRGEDEPRYGTKSDLSVATGAEFAQRAGRLVSAYNFLPMGRVPTSEQGPLLSPFTTGGGEVARAEEIFARKKEADDAAWRDAAPAKRAVLTVTLPDEMAMSQEAETLATEKMMAEFGPQLLWHPGSLETPKSYDPRIDEYLSPDEDLSPTQPFAGVFQLSYAPKFWLLFGKKGGGKLAEGPPFGGKKFTPKQCFQEAIQALEQQRGKVSDRDFDFLNTYVDAWTALSEVPLQEDGSTNVYEIKLADGELHKFTQNELLQKVEELRAEQRKEDQAYRKFLIDHHLIASF